MSLPSASPPQSRLWRRGRLVSEDVDLADLGRLLADPECLTWVDVVAPGSEVMDHLVREVGVAPLAVDHAQSRHGRPKATRHDGHLFLGVYATRLDLDGELNHESRLAETKISAFVFPRGLVTIRSDDGFDMGQVVARWDDNADLLAHAGAAGVGALLHGLLDAVVDGHFQTIQVLDDAIEVLEDVLFEDQPQTRRVQQSTYRLRKELVELRRVVLPMREVVNAVLRHRLSATFPDELGADERGQVERGEARLQPYYDDLYDHVLRATEWTESLRDMLTSLFETNLSLQDARLNTVMKKLAGWAAVIAVPTAVTGWYGQNVPFPGFGEPWGFWQSLTLVVVGSLVLYAVFKRRDWL